MLGQRQRDLLAGVCLILATALSSCARGTLPTLQRAGPSVSSAEGSNNATSASGAAVPPLPDAPPLELITTPVEISPGRRFDPVPNGRVAARSHNEAWNASIQRGVVLRSSNNYKVQLGLYTDDIVHEAGQPLMFVGVLVYDIVSLGADCPILGPKGREGPNSYKCEWHTLLNADTLDPIAGISGRVVW